MILETGPDYSDERSPGQLRAEAMEKLDAVQNDGQQDILDAIREDSEGRFIRHLESNHPQLLKELADADAESFDTNGLEGVMRKWLRDNPDHNLNIGPSEKFRSLADSFKSEFTADFPTLAGNPKLFAAAMKDFRDADIPTDPVYGDPREHMAALIGGGISSLDGCVDYALRTSTNPDKAHISQYILGGYGGYGGIRGLIQSIGFKYEEKYATAVSGVQKAEAIRIEQGKQDKLLQEASPRVQDAISSIQGTVLPVNFDAKDLTQHLIKNQPDLVMKIAKARDPRGLMALIEVKSAILQEYGTWVSEGGQLKSPQVVPQPQETTPNPDKKEAAPRKTAGPSSRAEFLAEVDQKYERRGDTLTVNLNTTGDVRHSLLTDITDHAGIPAGTQLKTSDGTLLSYVDNDWKTPNPDSKHYPIGRGSESFTIVDAKFAAMERAKDPHNIHFAPTFNPEDLGLSIDGRMLKQGDQVLASFNEGDDVRLTKDGELLIAQVRNGDKTETQYIQYGSKPVDRAVDQRLTVDESAYKTDDPSEAFAFTDGVEGDDAALGYDLDTRPLSSDQKQMIAGMEGENLSAEQIDEAFYTKVALEATDYKGLKRFTAPHDAIRMMISQKLFVHKGKLYQGEGEIKYARGKDMRGQGKELADFSDCNDLTIKSIEGRLVARAEKKDGSRFEKNIADLLA